MEKIMLKRLLTINQRDLFHLTKRQSAVLKRNNAIKSLEKQYTFTLPPQLNPNKVRHRTTNIQFELPIKSCFSKDAIITQTTNMNTEQNEHLQLNKIQSLKHYINTENNIHLKSNLNSRNKQYKKSLTSCEAARLQKESSFNSNGHVVAINFNNIKTYNKMNTNNRISNESKICKSFASKGNTPLRNSSYRYEPVIPVIANPLEVQEEDKIFNELNTHQDDHNIEVLEQKPHIKGKPIIFDSQKPLAKVYHFPPDLLINLEQAKKKKKGMSLERYQNHLLEVAGDSLSKEYKQKLQRKFFLLRMQCRQVITKQDYIPLAEVEEREKAIIDQTNLDSRYCREMFKTASCGFRQARFILPDIKFESVLKDNIG